jgi:CheY-like chemotaxis protein
MTTPIDESSLLLHETAVTYDGVLSKTLVTILIVDDSAMNRKMISRLFTSSDEFEYNLLEACNGQEGVEAVLGDAESNRIDKIDVILMDNQMPVMDGVTAVNLLRKGGFANLIVMISGDSMNSDSVSMSGCGANHVMLKPIRKDVLFDMIRSFIRDK